MRLHRTDHARVSARFDAAGAANRAFETLRATLRTAHQQGQLDPGAPDACAKSSIHYLSGAFCHNTIMQEA